MSGPVPERPGTVRTETEEAVQAIAVLMTCHNRKNQTLSALASLHAQTGLPDGITISVHLVDAGSTDGTATAVRSAFPDTDVISAGPDVFWGTGTSIAGAKADRDAHVLWLNDDVLLDPQALCALLRTAAPLQRPVVVAGATRSSDGALTTYSGFRLVRARLRAPGLELLEPDPCQPQSCETCNGNVVLVTAAARHILGEVDRAFPHRMGDCDYGLRARQAGIPVLLAPGHLGVCDNHPPQARGSSSEAGIGPFTALRRRASVREQPPGPWWRYCRRHLGPWAPLYFCSPYVTAMLRSTVRRAHGRRSA
ncbi:glycosyltransferase family 2 protein [Streptomyces sp. NBC_01262]|uniref:glycosyltransferase family 2 protein n=1 Tax=Streptomyces sp. NBC_01262 TaxID=2903803 RepID=UPI002E2FFA51|nr:glycosyltransferase family 2 protein [Streptomyces sp. NBC_01262]